MGRRLRGDCKRRRKGERGKMGKRERRRKLPFCFPGKVLEPQGACVSLDVVLMP